MRPLSLLSALGLLLLPACSHPGRDSHTEVFKTADDVAADRLTRQLQAHKELAISVLRFSRPDIEAKANSTSSLNISADGVSRSIDLSPIEPQLLHHPNEERALLRKYLEDQLHPFDVDHLKSLGFERTKRQLGFMLV